MPPLHRGAVLTLAGAVSLGLAAPTAAVAAVGAPSAAPAVGPAIGPVVGPAIASAVGSAGAKAPRCNAAQRPAKRAPYHGRSASSTYDRLFSPGPRGPHLAGWVPQGLTTWHNWNGRGTSLLLLGMYRDGAPSYLVGIDPRSGRTVGTLRTKPTHFGALGIGGGWLVAQDNVKRSDGAAVRRYRLSTVRTKMTKAVRTGGKPFLAAHGKPRRVYGASFMASHGGSLWLGRHSQKPNYMYRYTVAPSGRLKVAEGPWRVPARTQGLLVTERTFVFASTVGVKRGKLVVVKRSAPAKSLACVWTPSLPQNLTTVGGKVYAAYESGAAKFAKPGTRNRIGNLHTGSLGSLKGIVR
ncbi:MAG: hypothetical protein ACT4QF_24805 [Sporichthyaceae bacterium]